MVPAATRLAGASGSGVRMMTSKPRRAAAMASMRPSCPPPSTPIVDPGASGKVGTLRAFPDQTGTRSIPLADVLRHRLGERRARLFEPLGQSGIGEGQDLGRQQTGVA